MDASSSSPEVPATTTLPEVKSEILALLATNPPATSAPALASMKPAKVAAADTFT